MSVLKISHPTICDFYSKHPEFDLEKVNLAVIELLKLVNKNQNDSDSTNNVIMQNIQKALCSDVVQNHQQELIEKNMSELKTLLKELNNSDKPNTSHMDRFFKKSIIEI